MATIVEDKITRKRYFLLGAGLGMYKSTRPSFWGGNLVPHEESGEVQAIAVCDANGDITFIESHKLNVVSIDGVEIETLSAQLGNFSEVLPHLTYDTCPACGARVELDDEVCPDCELRLL